MTSISPSQTNFIITQYLLLFLAEDFITPATSRRPRLASKSPQVPGLSVALSEVIGLGVEPMQHGAGRQLGEDQGRAPAAQRVQEHATSSRTPFLPKLPPNISVSLVVKSPKSCKKSPEDMFTQTDDEEDLPCGQPRLTQLSSQSAEFTGILSPLFNRSGSTVNLKGRKVQVLSIEKDEGGDYKGNTSLIHFTSTLYNTVHFTITITNLAICQFLYKLQYFIFYVFVNCLILNSITYNFHGTCRMVFTDYIA